MTVAFKRGGLFLTKEETLADAFPKPHFPFSSSCSPLRIFLPFQGGATVIFMGLERTLVKNSLVPPGRPGLGGAAATPTWLSRRREPEEGGPARPRGLRAPPLLDSSREGFQSTGPPGQAAGRRLAGGSTPPPEHVGGCED